MFLYELSIVLKIPVHELKEWPVETLDEYRAFNLIRPFTKRADQHLQGYIIELLRNQNVTKKHQYKRADELIPYLKDGLPKFLEHELVLKAKSLLGSARTEWARKDVLTKIGETVEEELSKGTDTRDNYLISELMKIARITRAEISNNDKNNNNKD